LEDPGSRYEGKARARIAVDIREIAMVYAEE
jgi:hypothetical protein